MSKTDLIFESYNRIMEESYNKVFSDNKNIDPFRISEEVIHNYLKAGIDSWSDKALTALGGMTPRQYINGIENFDEVVEVFKTGTIKCDSDLPELLVDKLISYGDRAIDTLWKLASDKDLINSEEDFYIPLAAVKIIGNLGIKNASEFLINLLYDCDKSSENILEGITNALFSLGMPSAVPILEAIGTKKDIGHLEEHLLNTLVRLGRGNRTESIFKSLKNAFLKMNNKVLGAMLLGDYGDGRAIPALRGYAEKNKGKLDKETYNEIKVAIKRLGGNVDDL